MSYYAFPGGLEVISLSRHLTSNGGQAVQYIARSCRLDGNNKHGNPKDDIRKAVDMLVDEYARLGGDISDLI